MQMSRNSVFCTIDRVRRFKKAGPGGLPKKSKTLRKHKPSTRLSILIGILLATRIAISIIPVDFHP